jgi:hypothetical protein
MTQEPGRPVEPVEPASPIGPGGPAGGAVEPARLRDPVAFAGEIRAARRYEVGLMVKAAAVLAVLAVIFVLRALYLSLPAARAAAGTTRRPGTSREGEGQWQSGESR